MISVDSAKDQGTTFTFSFELYVEFEPQDISVSDFDDTVNISRWSFMNKRELTDGPGEMYDKLDNESL